MEINVLKVENLDDAHKDQISILFSQLSPNKSQLSLTEILVPENPIMLVYCKTDNLIVGIASMCIYKVISGHKGWIEDVIVDSNYRGIGIGRKLVEKLIILGNDKRLSEILLFAEKEKTSAVSLCKNLGFKEKESNLYKF